MSLPILRNSFTTQIDALVDTHVRSLVFTASGVGHLPGTVPDPGAVGGTTKFLREDGSWQVPPTVAALVSGVVAIGNNTDTGSVTGLALPVAPTGAVVSIQMPVNGLMLFAVVNGAPTTDGFDFLLSGLTDSANYKLSYILIP